MVSSVSRLGSNEQYQQLTLVFEPSQPTKKKCRTCNQEKDLTEFRQDEKLKEGYRSSCKQCALDQAKITCRECKGKLRRKEAKIGDNGCYYCTPCWELIKGRKKCIGCKEIKELQEFNKDSSRDDGYEYYCKLCSHERHEKKQAKAILKKGKKMCPECRKTKELSEFYEDTRTRTGFARECKECYDGLKKIKKEPDKTREVEFIINATSAARLKSLYNLTEDDYRRMYNQQGGVCAICKRPELKRVRKMLCVDHCHKTDQVRALLCSLCNVGLGAFEDNIESLLSAIEYLQQYQ